MDELSQTLTRLKEGVLQETGQSKTINELMQQVAQTVQKLEGLVESAAQDSNDTLVLTREQLMTELNRINAHIQTVQVQNPSPAAQISYSDSLDEVKAELQIVKSWVSESDKTNQGVSYSMVEAMVSQVLKDA